LIARLLVLKRAQAARLPVLLIKSSTIDCSAAGIKEGTGCTAAGALDKISKQVICILSGQAGM
jgi:hypothetical protein